MRINHQSRDLRYRKPYGATPCDTYVDLHIDLLDNLEEVDFILLNYAYGLKEFTEGKIMMQLDVTDPERTPGRYHVRLRTPGLPCLLFYWFEIRKLDKSVLYASRKSDNSGDAITTAKPPRYQANVSRLPLPYQITVYEKNFTVPDWYAGKIMYQIFPDRFKRGADYDYEKKINSHHSDQRIYQKNWDAEVDIYGKEPEGYKALDFFGGTLQGIREELDYIREMGVSIIYLNPIFSSRSNHRYDTADYMTVDPVLGTNKDFSDLCQAAKERGIRIILDGVFSHTGADSIYFNKYGHYPDKGAFQSLLEKSYSPYFNWYNIHQDASAITYDSWWGFEDLPAVQENDLTFRDYILGQNGVIRTWLARGASGFRLDVSDELPDSFLQEMRLVVKDQDPEAVILGEVWEDASNKVSYGAYRDFLLGRTHDNVMGYPFRQAVTDFFKEYIAADELNNYLENIREHYPPAAFASSMNLLGSHDTARFITTVAGSPDPGNRELQINMSLTDEQRQEGLRLLYLATFLQMTYPGTPSIYYGDEIAMEGYRDPFNRRTFDWTKKNLSIREKLAELGQLRLRYPVLQTGYIELLSATGRLFIFRRYLDDDMKDSLGNKLDGPRRIVIALNASPNPLTVVSPQGKKYFLDAFSGNVFIHADQSVYTFTEN